MIGLLAVLSLAALLGTISAAPAQSPASSGTTTDSRARRNRSRPEKATCSIHSMGRGPIQGMARTVSTVPASR